MTSKENFGATLHDACLRDTFTFENIRRALLDKTLPGVPEKLSGIAALRMLVKSVKRETKESSAIRAHKSEPAKQYVYARVRVKRCDGLLTTVSLNKPLYELHCETLGRKKVHAIIRKAAFEANFQDKPPTLSAKIRDRLIVRSRQLLRKGALRQKYEIALLPLLPSPPKPKLSAQERYQKYKHSKGYKRTYITVGAPIKDSPDRTALCVGLPFYERACAILGKEKLRATLRTGSLTYKTIPGYSRSEAARDLVVKHIYGLSQDPHVFN